MGQCHRAAFVRHLADQFEFVRIFRHLYHQIMAQHDMRGDLPVQHGVRIGNRVGHLRQLAGDFVLLLRPVMGCRAQRQDQRGRQSGVGFQPCRGNAETLVDPLAFGSGHAVEHVPALTLRFPHDPPAERIVNDQCIHTTGEERVVELVRGNLDPVHALIGIHAPATQTDAEKPPVRAIEAIDPDVAAREIADTMDRQMAIDEQAVASAAQAAEKTRGKLAGWRVAQAGNPGQQRCHGGIRPALRDGVDRGIAIGRIDDGDIQPELAECAILRQHQQRIGVRIGPGDAQAARLAVGLQMVTGAVQQMLRFQSGCRGDRSAADPEFAACRQRHEEEFSKISKRVYPAIRFARTCLAGPE